MRIDQEVVVIEVVGGKSKGKKERKHAQFPRKDIHPKEHAPGYALY